MFKILRKTARTGLVTIGYPRAPALMPESFRGAPRFAFSAWRDARPAAAACPTGAISIRESGDGSHSGGAEGTRQVTVDYGLCIFCGECAEADADGAVRMTREFELAARDRRDLAVTAEYLLDASGTQVELTNLHQADRAADAPPEKLERTVRERIRSVLGRSLAIREVDAGSCNGCEVEIAALTNPVYDLERLGIHFVASPRHADMLLVTGPVTRNMELALAKTYRAAPDPKVVVAVGACGISGGIFGRNYAIVGGVDQVVPVDVYVPGCPPRPHALLYGILLAVGRIAQKGLPQ
ncbi:MAG: NADH-quinone oxidoreductase subunit NuoB [Acidobacteria bacterium]|nr:NADH-quinone oxidoreductase subunit NuoB [Acidobacteriota bacterium]MBI3280847.1 NADH-quinone oxidoreductase subunit NuoB [Acidobacteriota bacterium]